MLRAASLDIKRDYEDIIYKLYDEEYKGSGDYKNSAAEWAMIISDYFSTNEISIYTTIINNSLKKERNLWEDKKWRLLMKIKVPQQFRKRMCEFTQVPRLATMSPSPKAYEKKEDEDW